MNKKIRSALISVFYKDGLDELVNWLAANGVTIYSTGGTQQHLEKLNLPVTAVESLTGYPSILGGRVKTLHPVVFGGILGKRDDQVHLQEMKEYSIPEIDLVIVDLYPFQETLASTDDEAKIIEKIDIGGPSMIRGAAKNFRDVVVVASKNNYTQLLEILQQQNGETTLEQRKTFASKAFDVVANYDVAISGYFSGKSPDYFFRSDHPSQPMRYGENPHQEARFYGDTCDLFKKLNGKELSYNNLVDVDAAIQLISEFSDPTFAIIKHTNVCGIAQRTKCIDAWKAALEGDPESAFGGVLVTNLEIDAETATAINEIFFEVLIAPAFNNEALEILRSKKNRILLQVNGDLKQKFQFRSVLGGTLVQSTDEGNYSNWDEAGGRKSSMTEKSDLEFANLVCKHLKSNAIALVKNKQLIGKGCGQTSRIDSLRQSLDKSRQFGFSLDNAVMASDAFFPFDDCVKMAHQAGIKCFIQPGGSIRDQDSIKYCRDNDLVMVITGMRHFRH